ncbi:hypothetical protein ACRYCC_42850 [Actinomadura scrupuli]|uniref:hypothetical protein n=1 Tax=Actinomadura scrupuli TaxID=559629 RepID=UPI003D9764D0
MTPSIWRWDDVVTMAPRSTMPGRSPPYISAYQLLRRKVYGSPETLHEYQHAA